MMGAVAFVACALVVVTSAIWVVTLQNLFRAALSLGLVLVGVAGLFLLVGAEFLACVQILIYVGAILTLVVFAIMLTPPLDAVSARRQPDGSHTSQPREVGRRSAENRGAGLTAPRPSTEGRGAWRQWPAAAVSLALFALLACVVAAIPSPPRLPSGSAPSTVSLQELGRELITTLALPFEVISIVFVAAMVGAIAVASKVHGPRSTVHSEKPEHSVQNAESKSAFCLLPSAFSLWTVVCGPWTNIG